MDNRLGGDAISLASDGASGVSAMALSICGTLAVSISALLSPDFYFCFPILRQIKGWDDTAAKLGSIGPNMKPPPPTSGVNIAMLIEAVVPADSRMV